MNYSLTPIIFRGKRYDSIKSAIESTGFSRYIIKKELQYINSDDKSKFLGFGRKPKQIDKIPTKEQVKRTYKGNVRKAAHELNITEKLMNQLIDQYEIERIDLSQVKILKSDENRPPKEELVQKYDEFSIDELRAYYKVGYRKLMRWFNHYGIEKRKRGKTASIKHALRHDEIRPSYETLNEEYEKYSIHHLSLKYAVDKHVVSNWLKDYDIDVTTNFSREEKELFDYCKSIDDSFIQNDRKLIAPLELDIVSHKHKLAIEYCGVYWHSETMGKNKQYHRNKYIKCRELGYKLLTIFETDDMKKVHALIRTHINKNERIYARKTHIKEIDKKEANQFHRDYHLNGSIGGSIHIALCHEEKIVMVASFTKSRYNKKVEYECSRMTSHSDYSVVGGASRLFKYFFHRYNVKSCITYADLRFGEGDVYMHCNFQRQKDSQPNYFYFKANELKLNSRVKYQKHRLKSILEKYDASMSEYENMLANNYHRIWDCGNAVYIYC